MLPSSNLDPRSGQLYAIEAEAKRASAEERLARLAALRAKQSKPVIDEIRRWLMTQRALPRSSLGKAIAYTSGLWPGLVRFLANPKIPLDTNGVERALRDVAVGRKNHYLSRAERGTRVAAVRPIPREWPRTYSPATTERDPMWRSCGAREKSRL